MLSTIKSAFALAAASALIVGAGSCGSSSTSTGTSAAQAGASAPSTSSAPAATTPASTTSTTPAPPASSAKGTSTGPGAAGSSSAGSAATHHGGDESIQKYGSAAAVGDKVAVTSAVQSYYAAIGADDGARACALLASALQRSLTHTLGRTSALRNKGCAGILQLLFRQRPGQPRRISSTVTVTGVRVNQDRGFALITTKTIPAGEIAVVREHGSWKIGSLIGSSLG